MLSAIMKTAKKEELIEVSAKILSLRQQKKEIDRALKEAEGCLNDLLSGVSDGQAAPSKDGLRPGSENGQPISQRVFQALKRTPRMPYARLVVVAYGEDTPTNRKKLRASLYFLRKAGRAKRVGEGAWETVDGSH